MYGTTLHFMLTLVGLGLHDELDITLRGLQAMERADTVFVEAYTSGLVQGALERLALWSRRRFVPSDGGKGSGTRSDDGNSREIQPLSRQEVEGAPDRE